MFQIKAFNNYSIKKIEKGWSTDEKYLIENQKEKLLIRLSDIREYEQKRYEFEILKKLELLDVPTSRAIDFGIDDKNNKVWMALSWIEGDDLINHMNKFSKEKQYKLGLEAGKILKTIHKLEIDEPPDCWERTFNKKINDNLQSYKAHNVEIPGGEAFIEYIANNRHLVSGRNQCFHHGDYHIGNMLWTTDKKIAIIDINRLDTGDPWKELGRITFCKDESPKFAIGRLDGYFEGSIPENFWRLLALYISSNALEFIVWALDYSKSSLPFMMEQAIGILKDYENMKKIVPAWYQT